MKSATPRCPQGRENLAYVATLGWLVILIGYYITLLLYVKAGPHFPWMSLIIFLTPLVAFTYVFAATRRPRTAAWLCFAVTPYFCHAVLLAFSQDTRLSTLGWFESLALAALFISSMLYIRWESQKRKAIMQSSPSASTPIHISNDCNVNQ